MKKSSHHILSLLRLLVFVFSVCTMVIRPAIQSLIYLDKQDFELVEKDSNEKENSKGEKVKLQLPSSYCYINTFIKKSSIFGEQHIKWDFSLEIHIPPPERV